MSHKNHKKPTAPTIPFENRVPRASEYPSENCPPDFRTAQMDMGGPYGWEKFNLPEFPIILQKIFDSQSMTWQEHRDNGSHLVKVAKIIHKMQKRLRELEKEDLDELYSLRLTGKKRIWGIKESNILWLLWWDPEHEICPSLLKNT